MLHVPSNTADKPGQGLLFRNDAGDTFGVHVHDKYPQMGDVHIEGRRYIEVSVEMFVELVAEKGYRTVGPEELTGKD